MQKHTHYAQPWLCHEDAGSAPSEKLLQAAWFHQRLRREQLITLDGRRLRVLHPGFWNREAGPDFRRAVIQWENERAQQGDIEIDLHSSGWKSHGHAQRMDYANVILHVVWKASRPGDTPTLELRDQLDCTLEELRRWHGLATTPSWPAELSGQCRMPLRGLSAATHAALLEAASLTRFETKASRMAARARTAGWEQTLWEFSFRTLGYKQNAWPMQHLAELLPRIRSPQDTVESLQAKLLGVAGLLPANLQHLPPESKFHARKLWDIWWRAQDELGEWILPRTVWHLHHLRPANHPQRRLALASHWLMDREFIPRMKSWGRMEAPPVPLLLPTLKESLGLPQDGFWSNHWTLRCPALPLGQPLLGTPRTTDLAINTFLPWLWAQACEAREETLAEELKRRYRHWPCAQDNSLLRLARLRLLSGETTRCLFRNAAAQQGLLQIVSDFCEHSNALCEGCPFPDLVEGWGKGER